VKGRRLLSNDVLYVPSDLVYWFGRTNHLAQGTSSGAAAHTSWHAAALHGLCEVVERDAAMLTWYARLAPPRIDEHGLPAETEVHLAVLRQAGYRVSVRLLSRDLDLPVAMCVARRFDGRIPALLLGTGCAPDARNAVARASGEILKSYLAYVHSDGAPSVWADPGPAEAALQPWQHLAYYARGAHRSALDLLDSSAGTVALDELRASDGTPAEELHRCLELLAAQGLDPIGVDYTPRDLRLIGVVLVKVLVPGLQPLHFGEAFRVLGGRRLYDLPARLGRATQRLEADDLNPLPHPFP
jgi:ribosomal protein S12 methylthiotransferase accessory factor